MIHVDRAGQVGAARHDPSRPRGDRQGPRNRHLPGGHAASAGAPPAYQSGIALLYKASTCRSCRWRSTRASSGRAGASASTRDDRRRVPAAIEPGRFGAFLPGSRWRSNRPRTAARRGGAHQHAPHLPPTARNASKSKLQNGLLALRRSGMPPRGVGPRKPLPPSRGSDRGTQRLRRCCRGISTDVGVGVGAERPWLSRTWRRIASGVDRPASAGARAGRRHRSAPAPFGRSGTSSLIGRRTRRSSVTSSRSRTEAMTSSRFSSATR